jgi:hypothetical protein|nr:hypothetical protein Q903MT_gene5392 [Picea sitchensis]
MIGRLRHCESVCLRPGWAFPPASECVGNRLEDGMVEDAEPRWHDGPGSDPNRHRKYLYLYFRKDANSGFSG